MVRAILDGNKTQTRRVVKKTDSGRVKAIGSARNWHLDDPNAVEACPYGKPGDQLWVRESFYQYGHWEPVEGVKTKGGRQKWKFVPDSEEILFDSSAVPEGTWRLGRHNVGFEIPAWHKRLARFMPRWDSCITLEIVSVRVERLQEISDDDAIAEGIERGPRGGWKDYGTTEGIFGPTPSYASLWNAINGAGSWDANPWVWVMEFKRVERSEA